ncbi:MAG: energy transducer TonB [Bacteroidales bacterium]|nr:energy transducer TonB [Bacteroidales bacterium]
MRTDVSKTIDEMVFENRNKEYGSYRLRRHYYRRVLISFLIAVSFVLIIALGYYWYVNTAGNASAMLNPTTNPYLKSVDGSLLSKEELDAYLRKAASPEEELFEEAMINQPDPMHNFTVTENAAQDSFTPPEEVKTNTDMISGTGSLEDSVIFGGYLLGDGTGASSGGYLDKLPEFPGGIAAVTRYLELNVFYPPQAVKLKINGIVLISFEVNRMGLVDNIKIERSINPIVDAEAVKAIKAMPRWKPGMRHGRPIPVKFVVPVNFMPMS